jgi:aspartyl-tRNA(Asn)/glutamyl-tRNA(Gln) amidotransferase subunit A
MGLVGYVPTYGIISRYGVIPYAPSFDHIGVITKYVADAAIVAQNLVEYDEKDYTSQKINDSSFFQNLKKKEKITFTVLTGIENYCDESVRTEYLNFLNQIKAKYSIKEYRLSEDILRALAPTYMILTYAEACSCHGNKTSIPFGKYVGGHGYDEIIIKARTEGFSSQVKRRMTIGAYITSAQNFESIFLKAKKVRTLIINEVNNILSGSDCLLLPGNSSVAHKIEHIKGGTLNKENLIGADTLMFANFAGIPSITIPLKTNGLPFGINISCSQFHDQDAFDIAYTLEEMIRGDNE